MKKVSTIKWLKTCIQLVKENIIQLTQCVYKMPLKCQKIARINTFEVEPPSTKMIPNHS